jgi:cytochrome P450
VIPLLGSANRDDTRYPNPDVFDLSRKPKDVLSFGAGPHYCIGAQLAWLESRLAMEILLQRFGKVTLQTSVIRWSETYVVRGPQNLPVRFEPREQISSFSHCDSIRAHMP